MKEKKAEVTPRVGVQLLGVTSNWGVFIFIDFMDTRMLTVYSNLIDNHLNEQTTPLTIFAHFVT